ncbi:MAG: GYD domain-containing protein [Thermogutta sp.]|nr:GYD domain-containing protein [Thermogutta sp.]HPU06105.1 GYD domain-containing protein [Thermogutta sp.]HPZ82768.1 GYD domain-containing protein [Thermogutta sp.]HQF13950.1 GYD domain-containing protein [Thermogutta sp.]
MATFVMLGKYSPEALRQISAERTEKFVKTIAELGGSVRAMFATLGEVDLVLIVDLPGIEQAAKASVVVSKDTGIHFSTHPAIAVKDFDQLVG